MSDFKLVYFEGCPEAKNIRAALLSAGVFDFTVVIQNHLEEKDPLKKLSSPSVLKGQELVYGIRTEGESSSCTFQRREAADEEKLVEKFRELNRKDSPRGVKLRSFLGPTLSALLVLKCPACIPGAVAFLSSIGLGFVLNQTALKIVLIMLLSLTMVSFLYSYVKNHRNYYPLVLGGIFSAGLYAGRFHSFEIVDSQITAYIAVAGLILTSLWDFKLKKDKKCFACV